MTRARTLILVVAALAVAGAAAIATAAEASVTLDGTVVCAKCSLKKADAKECQNVLVVEGQDGATQEYYIAKNETAEKYGHVCTSKKKAKVTGTVSEKDGRKWIAPSAIEDVKG